MKILTPLMIFLLLTSCTSQGWIIGNLSLTPSDTLRNTVFIEIMDVDSTIHFYRNFISDHSNWCYEHNTWEDVRDETTQ